MERGAAAYGVLRPGVPVTSVPYATLDCNGMSHLARTFRCTKEPYQRVIWAIREMVCGKKGVGEGPKHRTTECGRHPACIKAWGRTSKGASEDVMYFQSIL